MPNPRQLVFVIVVAVLGLAAGLFAGGQMRDGSPVTLELERATALGSSGRPLPEFALIDHERNPVRPERFEGAWTMLFFGYTHCPDVCPVTLSSLKQAIDALPAEAAAPVRVYFVSVDPERDTPELLADYVTYFDPGFVGITGDPDEIGKLTRGLGIVFARSPAGPGDGGYLVDHSASLLLINPRGNLHAVFSTPHEPAVIARDLGRILEAGA